MKVIQPVLIMMLLCNYRIKVIQQQQQKQQQHHDAVACYASLGEKPHMTDISWTNAG